MKEWDGGDDGDEVGNGSLVLAGLFWGVICVSARVITMWSGRGGVHRLAWMAGLAGILAGEGVFGQVDVRGSGSGAGSVGAGTVQEQVESEARRQGQSGAAGAAAGVGALPGQGQSGAVRRPRRAVDQTIGTSGRRLQRTPNVIGDLPGLGNASQFFADSGEYGGRLVSIHGDPLNDLPVNSNVTSFVEVTIPGERTTLGQSLGKPLTLMFRQPDQFSDLQITGLDQLSAGDRQRLRDFLSRQGTELSGFTGTISEDALAGLRARSDVQGGANRGSVDLFLEDVQFFKGGIAPEQLISLPRGGSMVTQHKIAESNSPMPRDRVYFHYNQFQSVPGIVGRGDVSRFVPGFEQTFNDSLSSVELRLPFAGTFDSTQTLTESLSTAGGSGTELGNLAFVFKQLLYSGEVLGFSAGASLELPTGDDTEITTSALSITRSCESVTVAPYVGFVAAPADRLFFQGFCQVQFDTNGETVEFQDQFQRTSLSGRLREAAILYTDLQSGYWLYRADELNAGSSLTGVAGLLELHMNQTLGGTNTVSSDLGGVPITFGTAGGSFGVANLTSGVTAEFNRRTNVTMAVVLPLTNGDRVFDSEFHVGLNHAFGGGGMFRQSSLPRGQGLFR